jgi:hypothetical protein
MGLQGYDVHTVCVRRLKRTNGMQEIDCGPGRLARWPRWMQDEVSEEQNNKKRIKKKGTEC